MATVTAELPGVAAEIEAIIGTEATLKLLERRGGTELFVPQQVEGTVLADIVGDEAAQAIVDVIGYGPLLLPAGDMRGMRARRARGYEMLKRGVSLKDVALEIGCHVRTVANWRAHLVEEGTLLPGPGQQLRLPFD
ncbi:MAG: helix-turn-helix domain-containing protein [Paracoccaceae bacterium]